MFDCFGYGLASHWLVKKNCVRYSGNSEHLATIQWCPSLCAMFIVMIF